MVSKVPIPEAEASTAAVDAERASRAFLSRSVRTSPRSGRPHVTLTFAQSSDGKIAGKGKQQVALSSPESMLMTHTLRTMHDGILVGIGTVLNDNPQLNARLLSKPPSVAQLPRPVVLDSSLRMPLDCKLLRNARNGSGRTPLLVCHSSVDEAKKEALQDAGAELIQLSSPAGSHLGWDALLSRLCERGIERLMVEGGAAVIDSLMARKDLIDTLLVTVAPRVVGPEGFGFSAPVPPPLSGQHGEEGDVLVQSAEEAFGPDRVIVWTQADTHCS